MQASYLSQIKQELKNKNSGELLEICLRLARFKKENKELLTYLLFEADDEQSYIESIKNYIEHEFSEINKSNVYFAKKSIRKILKNTNKFIRYSRQKQTEVELLIFFCRCLKDSGLPLSRSVALTNLYSRQLEKIKKSLKSLHEDLQFDYGEEINQL